MLGFWGVFRWRVIEWEEDNANEEGIIYLETWINRRVYVKDEIEKTIRQVLNIYGVWEDLSASNDYGRIYLRDKIITYCKNYTINYKTSI